MTTQTFHMMFIVVIKIVDVLLITNLVMEEDKIAELKRLENLLIVL
ncbi:TPA: hypothetical protein U1165_000628 [Streptococcus suis]|nr:hypothetical protein [Streptococcus suis]HEM4954807.1 hypothetical protein [Streptococcus suis]